MSYVATLGVLTVETRSEQVTACRGAMSLWSRHVGALAELDDVPTLHAILNDMLEATPSAAYALLVRKGRPYAHTFSEGIPEGLVTLNAHSSAQPTVAFAHDAALGTVVDCATDLGGGTRLRVGFRWNRLAVSPLRAVVLLGLVHAALLLMALLGVWSLRRGMHRDVEFAQRRLVESEERYRKLFEQAPESTMLLDPSGPSPTIADCNEATCRMHGYARSELIGKPIEFLDVPKDHPLVRERVQGLADGGVTHFEVEHVRRDGSVLPLEVTAQQVVIDGKVMIQAIDRDISDRKALERQRQDFEGRVRSSQTMEAVGQLAAGVTHDMNNTLGVILATASLLQRRMPSQDPRVELVNAVLLACQRGRELTQSLLDSTRRGALESQPVSVNRMATQTCSLLSRAISQNVALELSLAPSLPPALGDVGKMSQALMNVCINAVDAMEGRGKLRVLTDIVSTGATYVRLRVVDDGPGMDEATLQRATEPFFTTKAPGKGTGLGLAMAHSVARELGGDLLLESRPDAGTTVTFLFPTAPSGIPAMADEPTVTVAAGRRDGHVLLIDDEMLIRWSGQQLLEELGFRVTVSDSGQAAVALLQEDPEAFALAILDVAMPEMSGPEVMLRLRAIAPRLPVLIATGLAPDARVRAMLAHGRSAYIAKPFDTAALSRAIDDLLCASFDAVR
ncbi:MAG: PAS domain S-box protein [Myxococcota bacterium]